MEKHYEVSTKVEGIRARHLAKCGHRNDRRCTCRTSIRYVARIRDENSKKIARVFADEGEAQGWRAEMVRRKKAGFPLNPDQPAIDAAAGAGITVEELAERFISDAKLGRVLNRRGTHYTRGSLYGIRECAKNGWSGEKGGTDLRKREVSTITEADVQNIADDLGERDASASRVRNVVNTMRVLLRYAEKRGIIDEAPRTDRIDLPRLRSSKKRRAPTPTVASNLIAAAPKDHRLIWATFAYTGARLMEGLMLEVDHFDFEKGIVTLPGTKTDNAIRPVPLIEPYRSLVRAHMLRWGIRDGMLFPPRFESNVRGFMSPEQLREKSGTAWDTAGLARFVPHEFRHGYITWLSKAGVNEQVRKVIVGHARARLDSVYVHVDTEDIVAAGALLEAFLKSKSGDAVVTTTGHHRVKTR